MKRRILHPLFFLILAGPIAAQTVDIQNYRTIDGTYNNLQNPGWGAAGDNLVRRTPVGYADGISAPGGTDRPNPRDISNKVFAQNGLLNDPFTLSDYLWVFGQFLDHDFGLTPDGSEPLIIQVPTGDPWMDPNGGGRAIIPMMRNLFDPATGTGADNPRQHVNTITAYIDGSAVYGSDEERANWLRTFSGGKLKVSAGNLLPYNTTTGEKDAPIDPAAPHMDNPVRLTDKLFVAGDSRANENPLLASIHTLFVREHNRLCDELADQHPDWDDEQLYQHARKIVGGLIQSVVYNEWLPSMGVTLPDYRGYNDGLNAQLSNVFTAAAFRLGHTLLNGTLRRMDDNGEPMAEGHMGLRDAFFNPDAVPQSGGIEPFLKGMATQMMQRLDTKVIDDVRNFLFGPPGAGGLDLPAININRGRERGLPDFNTVREAFGLPRYNDFRQLTNDYATLVLLVNLYRDVNNIDPWVGFLMERPMQGALFGPTLMMVFEQQFLALREGDRFFYENDPVLTDEEKAAIRNTTMHDIIMRNTGITLMQSHVFKAMPHSQICDNMTVDVGGRVISERGTPLTGVSVILGAAGALRQQLSDPTGRFSFPEVPGCDMESLGLNKEGNAGDGVTTLDLILVQKHILGVQELDSPYKIIAADVNSSGSLSTFDLISIRKVILSVDKNWPGETPVWRFLPANYTFDDPANPFASGIPDLMSFDLVAQDMKQDFIGIKLGDINSSYEEEAQLVENAENRGSSSGLTFRIQDVELKAGRHYAIAFYAESLPVEGYQFALRFDQEKLAFERIEPGALSGLSAEHFGVFEEQGLITTSWIAANNGALPDEKAGWFFLNFQALQSGMLSQVLALDEKGSLRPVAYDQTLQALPVNLSFEAATTPEVSFRLHQNRPNPFRESTVVPFELAASGSARLILFDASGRVLTERTGWFDEGYNEWTIRRHELPVSGIVYYRLETEAGAETRKMVLMAH